MGSTGSSRSSSARPIRDWPPGTATWTTSGSRNQISSNQESRTVPRVKSSSNSKRTRRPSGRSTPSKRWSTWCRSKPLTQLLGTQGGISRVHKPDNQDIGYPDQHVVCYHYQGETGYQIPLPHAMERHYRSACHHLCVPTGQATS